MGSLVESLGFEAVVLHGMGSLVESLGFRVAVVHGNGSLVESLGFWVAVVHGMDNLVESLGFEAVVLHGMGSLVENSGFRGRFSTEVPIWWRNYTCYNRFYLFFNKNQMKSIIENTILVPSGLVFSK